ncbi:NCAIR mutase (PurE)-related proteins [Ectocarpus siliculosus]|uniref:phosphoribosylaminoimidazole carboxylase n=1 Tax=Ectocarpus siliculosus TaxID=2880 RepID=D8LNM3_ECTSI|nr:NCAIR mutase (PurE)-related proteins [Ectocarpus siliculosus]|eukprot:CBN78233.1 NCAIR mutase (PurE)-related proteins [Ectocarpus siliculosus]
MPTTRSLSSTATGGEAAGDLPALLARVAAGDLSPATAASQLAPLLVSGGAQAEDVGGFAKIDHDRRRRVGFPEVVFGDGKSAEQITDILAAMIREARAGSRVAAEAAAVHAAAGNAAAADDDGDATGGGGSPVVATRVSPEKWLVISDALPGQLTYHADARIVSFGEPPQRRRAAGDGAPGGSIATSISIGTVAVLSAGTSDLAVAEEAAVLAELAGAEVSRFHDVGVAGIHRLLGAIPSVQKAGVAICVAGMDGAMPGVVAGLVKCPVVAVPTSVGYGAAMSGLAPLLTMLNACAPGVSVVNIDNGFGAAAFAVKLLKSSKVATATRETQQ